MYKKICLFEVPPFYVDSELEDDVIKAKVEAFDKGRSLYGFSKLTQRQKHALRKEFCKQSNLKFAFDSQISFEIHKQGRTKQWLHRCLLDRGFKVNYVSLTQKITGYSTLKSDMRKVIYELLKIV